ncbi:unnamed protein product, partial [marine sediment metagenome]
VGDKLSGTDERLDYVVGQIEQLPLADIPKLKIAIESLKSALEAAGIEVKMPGEIREIRITQNVLPTQAVILTQEAPFDGYVREVKIHWPPGCAGWVSVRVGYRTKQFCPFEGFLALDNVTPTYPFNEYVQHTENLWVEIQNADGTNAHRITVMLNIREKV